MPPKKATKVENKTAAGAKQQRYRQNLTGLKKIEEGIKNRLRSRKNNKKRAERGNPSWAKMTPKARDAVLAAIDEEFATLAATELADARAAYENEQAAAVEEPTPSSSTSVSAAAPTNEWAYLCHPDFVSSGDTRMDKVLAAADLVQRQSTARVVIRALEKAKREVPQELRDLMGEEVEEDDEEIDEEEDEEVEEEGEEIESEEISEESSSTGSLEEFIGESEDDMEAE
jgi:hypothetical protein